MNQRRNFIEVVLCLLLLLFSAGSMAAEDHKRLNDIEAIGNRNVNKGSINFTSLLEEIDLGLGMAADYERQIKLLDDAVITDYVDRMGQNLVRNSDAMVPFTIKVVDSWRISVCQFESYFKQDLRSVAVEFRNCSPRLRRRPTA